MSCRPKLGVICLFELGKNPVCSLSYLLLFLTDKMITLLDSERMVSVQSRMAQVEAVSFSGMVESIFQGSPPQLQRKRQLWYRI